MPKAKLPKPGSPLEALFAMQCAAFKLPPAQREYQFHDQRKWRFDFAWPDHMLAVELDGGIYTGGRHTRGKGYANDCEKNNTATLDGWRVLHYVHEQIKSLHAINEVETTLNRAMDHCNSPGKTV